MKKNKKAYYIALCIVFAIIGTLLLTIIEWNVLIGLPVLIAFNRAAEYSEKIKTTNNEETIE